MDTSIKTLHLASYFSGISAVYENIFQSLDKLNVSQTIYVPFRTIKRKKDTSFLKKGSKVIWRPIFTKLMRFAYFYKIRTVFKDVQKELQVEKQDIIHAHTWYTDGGVAYRIYKKYNIPYIITVRSTDISVFAKNFIHLHSFSKKILTNAQSIIFVSQAYKNTVLNLPFLNDCKNALEAKSYIIPNGVDQFWVKNAKTLKQKESEEIKLIFIGNFLKRKNVKRLIGAIDEIADKQLVSLKIVGGGREYSNKIVEVVKKNENVNYVGKVYDKNKLSSIIRENDIFVMPSYNETFGLVYIEALSQGLPILYSKNEGIDGFYQEKIGEAVDPFDVGSIAEGILKIHNSYSAYKFNPSSIVANHNWDKIANQLIQLYSKSN